MARLSTGITAAALGLMLGAGCSSSSGTSDGGTSGSGTSSSSGSAACTPVGNGCYGSNTCPVGSTCDEATFVCCAYVNGSGGASGQGASGGASGQGASGGAPVTGSCANGQACPSGSTCDAANGNCYGNVTGSCATGQPCPSGSYCDSANGNCYANSGGSSGAHGTSGGSGASGASGASGSGGASGGTVTGSCANGAQCPPGSVCDTANSLCYSLGSSSGGITVPVVTGSCFDGGTCPAGSTCSSVGLCEGTVTVGGNGGASGSGAGSSSGSSYFWSGSSGGGGTLGVGSSGQVALGTCNDGGVCPPGTTCDTADDICWGTVGSSGGNPYGGGSSSGAINPSAPGVGTNCSTNPSICEPQGLFCDPLNSLCEVPVDGEPCLPTPGCQGTGITCVETQNNSGSVCTATCTSTSQCPALGETCKPSTVVKGSVCTPNECSDYFGTCNASGTNDGTCEVISIGDLFSCSDPDGCGVCVQGGNVQDGNPCDQTRGSNFCQTGSTCSANSDGNTMCAPICSPYNGPTLCPYGYGCYWPIGQNIGTCVLICPIDPLCPLSVPLQGCANCNDLASLLCLGSCCVMDCPGSSYCQLISGTPIPACLP